MSRIPLTLRVFAPYRPGVLLALSADSAAPLRRIYRPDRSFPARGLRAAGWLSVRAAGLAPESQIRLEAALDHLGLPVRMPAVSVPRLLAAMRQDKKRAAGTVRWVLTPRIGDASVPRAVETRLVRAALVHSGARTARA